MKEEEKKTKHLCVGEKHVSVAVVALPRCFIADCACGGRVSYDIVALSGYITLSALSQERHRIV